jgi:fucose permease
MDYMLTAMQVAALAVAGMCHALLGSIKVPLARKLEIDEARVGGLVSVFGFTLIPMVLVFGFLVDAAGKQAVLAGGFGLLIVAMMLLAWLATPFASEGVNQPDAKKVTQRYPLALIAVLLLGTGWSALVNVLNVTSPPAFLPPEDLKTRMSYAMNMGDFVFGMGAFLTPLLVAALIRKLSLSTTLFILASFAIVPVMLGFGVNWQLPQLNPEGGKTVAGGLAELLSDPIVWLCCLAFFCHVPIEAAVATWATTLMTNKGIKEGTASTLLSVFWLTFMASRLVAALTLQPGWDTTLVISMAVLCILFTLGIAFSRNAGVTCTMVILAGCILGPIFPTLIAILLSHLPEELHGRAVGIFFCIGGIGWTAIPMLIGYYAKKTSVQRAFLIATVSAVLLTALCAQLAVSLERKPVSPTPPTAKV